MNTKLVKDCSLWYYTGKSRVSVITIRILLGLNNCISAKYYYLNNYKELVSNSSA